MKNPFVSVCITTYNMEKYIAKALDSVLTQQTDFPVEIIVADDCSEDKTLKIVESYKRNHENIRILYANTNRGLIENFVNALKESQGEYIATLDADDYWIDNNKLQKQANILNKNKKVGFVYTNFFYENEITKNRKTGISLNHMPSLTSEYIDNLINLWPHISTPLFRKNLLDFNELHEFVRLRFHAQDLPLFVSLSLKTKGFFLPEVTTVYNFRTGSMSRNTDIKKRIDIFYKTQTIGDYFIEKYPIPKDIADKRDFDHRLKVLSASWLSRDFDYVYSFTKDLSFRQFMKYAPRRIHVFLGSKNKWLFHILKMWVLRKRRSIV